MTQKQSFPVQRIDEVRQAPDDFRLIERVPITRDGMAFPVKLAPAVGDEIDLVLLDFETTGLDAIKDAVIELGLVRLKVSPSTLQVTEVCEAESHYEDPGFEIPEVITQITGITNQDVAGKRIDDAVVDRWLEGDPVVVAHNAGFDAKFGANRFPALGKARWACTAKGVNWRALGFESAKLEYLVYRHGFFYQGHRASTDCLAVAWLLHRSPKALGQLLQSEADLQYSVKAISSPFDVKDQLKERGYRWNPEKYGKVWRSVILQADLSEEKAFLAATYPRGDQLAVFEAIDSRVRFL